MIFETSAINGLVDGGTTYEPLMRGLACGLEAILTGMTVGELIANKRPKRRAALLSRLERLPGSGRCLAPPNEIIRLLVREHWKRPSDFDWMNVNVRALPYEVALRQRDFTNELCMRERSEQFRVQKAFKTKWTRLRPKLDEILKKDPSKRPNNYQEAVAIALRDGGVLWGLGQDLYKLLFAADSGVNDHKGRCS